MRNVRVLGAALCVILLAAGCAENAPPARGPAKTLVQELKGPEPGAEPRVVTWGNLVLIADKSPSDLQREDRHPYVWRSNDHGQTFEALDVPTLVGKIATETRGDEDVAIIHDTIYVATMWNAGVEVTSSGDQGATWSEPVLASPPGVDRPWIVPVPAGDVGIVYARPGTGEWLALGRGAPLQFEQRLIAGTNDIGCACTAGLPVVTGKGHLLVPFPGASGLLQANELGVAESVDPLWSTFTYSRIPSATGAIGFPIAATTGQRELIVFSWGGPTSGIRAITRGPSLEWSGLIDIGPGDLRYALPFAVGVNDNFTLSALQSRAPSGEWKLVISTLGATSATASWRALDVPIVHEGGIAQQLGDFLSIAFDERGKALVAYSSDHGSDRPRTMIAFTE